jgi:sugar lactone lactonase YvrE
MRSKEVAVDSTKNIYMIEFSYAIRWYYDSQGRSLMNVGGTGKKAGEFYIPNGVWTDRHDQIYVADMYNGRITVLQYLGGQP